MRSSGIESRSPVSYKKAKIESRWMLLNLNLILFYHDYEQSLHLSVLCRSHRHRCSALEYTTCYAFAKRASTAASTFSNWNFFQMVSIRAATRSVQRLPMLPS